jgi:hypothetical protein
MRLHIPRTVQPSPRTTNVNSSKTSLEPLPVLLVGCAKQREESQDVQYLHILGGTQPYVHSNIRYARNTCTDDRSEQGGAIRLGCQCFLSIGSLQSANYFFRTVSLGVGLPARKCPQILRSISVCEKLPPPPTSLHHSSLSKVFQVVPVTYTQHERRSLRGCHWHRSWCAHSLSILPHNGC